MSKIMYLKGRQFAEDEAGWLAGMGNDPSMAKNFKQDYFDNAEFIRGYEAYINEPDEPKELKND